MSRFETCLDFVLKEEGGFVDHPQDPGGATNHGITKDTWEAWAKKPATTADIRNLKVADVVPIYRDRYWEAAKCPRLPLGVDLAVFDFAVNSGPATAIRHLQKVADTEVDGLYGPATNAAVWGSDATQLIFDLCQSRYLFLQSLHHFPTFRKGWTARIARVLSQSLASRMI
jgi:lysozyme family protein